MPASSSERPSRTSEQFASQVNGMFDRIAGHYDAMNSVMTAGLHHRWRQRAAARAQLTEGCSALDVCCGTGDLALELAGHVGPTGTVIGCDFSEPMLELARAKSVQRWATAVRFEHADALALPYEDETFDAVTVGFGVRNLSDLDRGLAEMARVLKPGGRLVILEITQPPTAAPVAVLLAVVRPHRAAAGDAGRGPRRLHLPARVGAQLPIPARAGGAHGRRPG